MNKIQDFDLWLVDSVFQRFAHWFQRLTGMNTFFLARAAIILFLGLYAAASHPQIIDYLVLTALIAINLSFIRELVIAEKEYESQEGQEACANSMRIHPGMVVLRIIFVMNALIYIPFSLLNIMIFGSSWAYIAMQASALLTVIGPYFASCTPLPRQPKKAPLWVRSLFAVITPRKPAKVRID